MDVLGSLAGKASSIVQNPAIDYKKFALGASWAIFGLESYILWVSRDTSFHLDRAKHFRLTCQNPSTPLLLYPRPARRARRPYSRRHLQEISSLRPRQDSMGSLQTGLQSDS